MSIEPVEEHRLVEQTEVSPRLVPTSGYRISSNRRTISNSSNNNHNHTTSRKREVVARAVPPCWATEASRPTTKMQQLLCHIINITSHSSNKSSKFNSRGPTAASNTPQLEWSNLSS